MKRLACLLALGFSSLLAHAAPAIVVTNVNLRAGPDTGYPRIATVPSGTGVDVQGCTQGYEWCDVIVGPDRGWIAAGYLQSTYQDRTVYIQDNGARIGLPIISFVIGSYWGNYYANRPFYRQRDYWYHRPFVHRPPPRPIHRPPSRPQPGWGGHRPSRPGVGHGPARPPVHGPGNGHRPPSGNRPGNGHRPSPGRPRQERHGG